MPSREEQSSSSGPRLFVPVPIWCSTEANGISRDAFTLSFAHLPVRCTNDGTLSRMSVCSFLPVLFDCNRPEVHRGPVVCSARRHLGVPRGKNRPHSSSQCLPLCHLATSSVLSLVHLFGSSINATDSNICRQAEFFNTFFALNISPF